MGTNVVETGLHRKGGETSKVFMTVQALLSDGELHFPVHNDSCRGVGVKHIEAQNEHELGVFSCLVEPWGAHLFKLGLRVESSEMDFMNAALSSVIDCPVAADSSMRIVAN